MDITFWNFKTSLVSNLVKSKRYCYLNFNFTGGHVESVLETLLAGQSPLTVCESRTSHLMSVTPVQGQTGRRYK